MGPRLRGGWRAPLYWEGERDDWQVFTLHGMQELELQAPVTHVSYFEADAYARWAGPVAARVRMGIRRAPPA